MYLRRWTCHRHHYACSTEETFQFSRNSEVNASRVSWECSSVKFSWDSEIDSRSSQENLKASSNLFSFFQYATLKEQLSDIQSKLDEKEQTLGDHVTQISEMEQDHQNQLKQLNHLNQRLKDDNKQLEVRDLVTVWFIRDSREISTYKFVIVMNWMVAINSCFCLLTFEFYLWYK